MPYTVDIKDAETMFPDYTFIRALTPSEQKAAFHVKDKAGADFCLKLIAPNYERDRLDREILALQTINHPNVVRLIEYTFSSKPGQQRHYIVEEFIEGRRFTGQAHPREAVDYQRCSTVLFCPVRWALRNEGEGNCPS